MVWACFNHTGTISMSNISTKQPSATSLPPATQHQVEHLFDSPLTVDEYSEHLSFYRAQFSRLKSLFAAIQADDDVKPGFIVSDLALVGEDLAGLRVRELRQRQEEFDTVLTR
jgi:hypothetical protein